MKDPSVACLQQLMLAGAYDTRGKLRFCFASCSIARAIFCVAGKLSQFTLMQVFIIVCLFPSSQTPVQTPVSITAHQQCQRKGSEHEKRCRGEVGCRKYCRPIFED